MKFIDSAIIEKSLDYSTYRKLVNDLLDKKTTTGGDTSESMLHYTQMNVKRMDRWDKKTKLNEETISALNALERKYLWLVITEGWCGDAAQIVPVMNKMAELSDHIELRLILRDQNLEVMDAFLTNGGRSIPKLIVLDPETNEVLCSWGPRPAELQEQYMSGRAEALKIEDETERKEALGQLAIDLHTFYAKDKGQRIQKELSVFVCNDLEVEKA